MGTWAKFTGHPLTAFDYGLPARDLTDEDKAGMTEEQIRRVEESPRYRVRPERKPAAEPKSESRTADTGATKKGGE